MNGDNRTWFQRLARCLAWSAAAVAITLTPGRPPLALESTDLSEPNDVLETATPSGLVGIGTVLIEDVMIGDGEWAERDVDLYSFEMDGTSIPALVSVDVDSSGSQLDPHVRLFDASGTELVNNDDSAFHDVNARLQTYLLGPGIYYVGVSSSRNPNYRVRRFFGWSGGDGVIGTTGAYGLTITTEAATVPDSPYEPNDTIGSAVDMGGASFTVTGEFIGDGDSGRQDVDIYWLRLSGAARLDIRVRAQSIGSTLDAVVQTIGVLGVGDDGPDGSADPTLSVGSPSARDVYVLVYGAGNPRYRSPLVDWEEPGSVGPYELTVTVSYLDDSGIGEPNDSIVMATRTNALPNPRDPSAPQVFRGFLGDGPYGQYRGDRDFYEIRALESGVVTVDVAAASVGSELDPVLVLYDRSGRLLGVNDNIADSTDARLDVPVFCPSFGYERDLVGYVMVFGTRQRLPDDPFVPRQFVSGGISDERIEEYQVGDTSGSTGPYTLALSWTPAGDTCGMEPDDTLPRATDTGLIDEGFYLCSDGFIGDGDCLHPEEDVDIWSVEVAHTPARLVAQVAWCFDADTPLSRGYLQIYDSNGALIATSGYAGSEDTPYTLALDLRVPGKYYAALSQREYYDPLVPCTGPADDTFPQAYQLSITLTQRGHHMIPPNSPGSKRLQSGVDASASFFSTQLGERANSITRVSVVTGETIASFTAPEPRLTRMEGLAYEGDQLYYVGAGQYPKLYELDSNTGEVLDEYRLWVGSGFYSDAVVFRGELYILDYYDRAVHVLDSIEPQLLRTLSIRMTHGLTIGGGLAALSDPDLLYVADAFNTGLMYEVNPADGTLRGFISPLTNRPTSLASIGPSTLLIGDSQSDTVEIIDRAGTHLGDLELGFEPGALAGHPSVGICPDVDADGICDLVDNCKEDHNVLQADMDGDGVGDACDGCPNDPENDVDGDGVCGDVDACDGYDDRADQDGDAIPDDCDNCPSLANAVQIDCDGDGRGDLCAIAECASDDPQCQDCNQNGVPDNCDLDAWQTAEVGLPGRFAAETFGASVAADGDAVAIITPGTPRDWRRPGFAHVYRLTRDASGFVEESELIPYPWTLLEEYVDAIAVRGDRVIVGTRARPSENVSWPIVHSFRPGHGNSLWEEETRIVINEDASDSTFDMSVAIAGDFLAVGTAYSSDNGVESGAVRVFELSTLDEQARLLADDNMALARFGSSVAIDGAVVAVGAPGHPAVASDAGSAYVFRRDAITGNWNQEATLVAPNGGAGDGFGTSIAIEHDLVVIGAPGDDDHGTDTGAAYVFRHRDAEGPWHFEAKLSTGALTVGTGLGHSVSISGETVVVGGSYENAVDATPAVYVFQFESKSSEWIELAKLEPRDGAMGRKFGWSVSVSGQTAIVGAPVDPSSCTESNDCESGAVYAFALPSHDCNLNDIPDACDLGDVDGDGQVTLVDYAEMHSCLTGPCDGPGCRPPRGPDRCCAIVDFDGDGDVDVWDYAQFQLGFANRARVEP